MKLTLHSIRQLKEIISGDSPLTNRMTGQELVDFFNDFGEKDSYVYPSVGIVNEDIKDGRSPSRNEYVVQKLQKFNGSKKLKDVLEKVINFSSIDCKQTAEKVSQIIKGDGCIIKEQNGIHSIITNVPYTEPAQNEVHFEGIQNQILEALDKAEFTIWAAVAWFTDPVIFNKLVEKKAKGVNIQVLIQDDEINKNSGLKYEDHFEVKRIPKKGYFENLMHNKFCVIDSEVVVNGSYNWTKKANFNRENITVSKDRELAKRFAQEFIRIKTGN